MTLEKLHDLAVDMARKKRHQLLDRHYSVIQTVASVQDNWNDIPDPPFSRISSGRMSTKADGKLAELNDESSNNNTLNHKRDKFRSLGQYWSTGRVRRRASDRELDALKRNRDDLTITLESNEIGRDRFATYGGPLPGGDQALLVMF